MKQEAYRIQKGVKKFLPMVFIIDKVIANCLQERIPQEIIYHFSFHQTKKIDKEKPRTVKVPNKIKREKNQNHTLRPAIVVP